MQATGPNTTALRVDVCSLEADIAFFEARLSLAAQLPDTAYQRAQIKTYRTLGRLLRETLQTLQPENRALRDAADKVSVA